MADNEKAMEYNTYTKGKNSIQATERAWELLYKDKGYKLAKDATNPAGSEEGADDDGNGGGAGDNGEGKDPAEK